MSKDTIRTRGFRELYRACNAAPADVRAETRKAFFKVGDVVRDNARSRIRQLNPRTARYYRTRVQPSGVKVDSSKRKTTGLRPDWGKTQMRKAMLPALHEEKRVVEQEMIRAVERVARTFERRR